MAAWKQDPRRVARWPSGRALCVVREGWCGPFPHGHDDGVGARSACRHDADPLCPGITPSSERRMLWRSSVCLLARVEPKKLYERLGFRTVGFRWALQRNEVPKRVLFAHIPKAAGSF